MGLDFVSPFWRLEFLWLRDFWNVCAHLCLLCLTFQFSDLSGYIILKYVLILLIGSVIQFHIFLIRNSRIRKAGKTQVLNLYIFEVLLNVFLRNIMCLSMYGPYIYIYIYIYVYIYIYIPLILFTSLLLQYKNKL